MPTTQQSLTLLSALASLLFAGPDPLSADDQTRAVVVEEIRNEKPPFMIRVSVDQPDLTYEVGETMTVKVVSEEEGYLYLFYLQADGEIALLFPNKIQSDNKIPADESIAVPATGDQFRLRIAEPTGQEVLKAVVTKQPLEAEQVKAARNALFKTVSGTRLRAVYVEELQHAERTWAEHSVRIKTFPKDASAAHVLRRGKKRIALCIGISQFEDSRVRDLHVCHNDAEQFAEMLRQECGFDEVFVLTNSHATKDAIEQAVRQKLVESSEPDDEVVLYWSGHGARIADTGGDEADGLDELLIPFDADVSTPAQIQATTILDDTFGRWIQDLDGRRVLIVLDTCHSGGQANQEKSVLLGGSETAKLLEGVDALDFMDGELARTKDIGQTNVALLASSKASEISLERREGDLSVMTYYFIRTIKNGARGVELTKLHERLSRAVADYVSNRFNGVSQAPVLVNQMTSPFILNP